MDHAESHSAPSTRAQLASEEPPTRRGGGSHFADGNSLHEPHRSHRSDTSRSLGAGLAGRLGHSVSVKWMSALVVCALSAFASLNAAWLNSLWVSVVVISVAGILVAAGWERLVGAPIPLPSRIFMSLSTIVASIAVAFVQDQVAIVFVLGVVLAGLVGIEIWTAPSPRDHSAPRPSDDAELSDDQVQYMRRDSWVASSTSSSLASSMTGLLIAVGGTAWIAMTATDAWRLLLPVAAAIVAFVVIGDQIGSSWKGQSFFALLLGIVTGAIGAGLMIVLGHGATLGHLVLPNVATLLGPEGTVVVLGVGTGIIVSVAVILIDAVFGSHDRDGCLVSAGARGAAKFLMCGLVVYTVVRVAGT